jgi:hypothetical protein
VDTSTDRGRLAAVAGGAGAPDDPRPLEPGPLRETLLVEGLPIGELPAGTRLRVGPSAVVELAPPAAGAGPGVAAGVAEVGENAVVPARVLDGGRVRAGDAVVLDAVAVPLTDVLDLHAFRPEETGDAVAGYLAEAHAAGLREVRIVHGRGRGVQRALVQRLLARAPEVAGFADAPPERGGWGATVVRLRPGEPARPA